MNVETAVSGRAVAKLAAGAPIVGIVPTTIEETFRLAELIHQSGLAPYQLKSPAAVTVVLLKGLEIGLPPMAALECIGVISNKACLHSDGIPALLWARGFKIKEWYENEDDLDRTVAHCVITRPEGGEYAFKYSAQDAKNNGLWDTRAKVERTRKDGTKYTADNDAPWFRFKKRMLRMRCRGWHARDCAADVLKGIPIFEEQADINLTRDEYSEIKVAPKKALELPDIPDAKEPATSGLPNAQNAKADLAKPTGDKPAKDPAKTDAQFLEDIESVFAAANDMDALNEVLVHNETATEERGLQQAVGDKYQAHKIRIYDGMV